MIRFTEAEKRWIKENYPLDESQNETFRRFCKKFGNKHTKCSLVNFCKNHRIQKPLHRQKFQEGNTPWSTRLTKAQHKKHFSEESYQNMISSATKNFANIRNRIKFNAPDGYVLTDLGNGEYIPIERSIYKCMEFHKVLHKGELTKAIYETYLVKREIEKTKGKRIMRNNPRNAKEYLDKIRSDSIEKTSKCIVAVRGETQQEFASLSEASRKLNIPIGCISRVLNGSRSHTHQYKFYLKGERL